jgi:hypothetical protein
MPWIGDQEFAMNRDNFRATAFTATGVAALGVLLLMSLSWPIVAWAILGIATIVGVSVIANLLYVFMLLERGYYTEDERAGRLNTGSHHTARALKFLLHPRVLWHR